MIRTDPAAGTMADRGGEVRVYVSQGPELIMVPDVRGRTVESANAALRNLGFDVEVRGSFAPGGRVRAQDPMETRVKKGSTVTLYLI